MNTPIAPFFLALMIIHFSCSTNKSTPQEQAPNVIFILADDLGYGELGAYGQQLIETPHIDELAQRGMKLTQHYAGSAVCAPSRCVLMTGMHTGHAFVRGNDEWAARGDVWNFDSMYMHPRLEGQRPIPDSIMTIGELLQGSGYVTGAIGKWGLGAPETEGVPNKQGFDFFFGYNCQRQAHTYFPTHLWKNEERFPLNNKLEAPHKAALPKDLDPLDPTNYEAYHQNDYAATLMQQEALQFIETNAKKPFFLYYPTPIPHVALQAPKHLVNYYRKKFGEEEPYTGKSYFPCRYPRATYAAMITYLDEQVGELIEKLRNLGIYENTIILFSSDNGPTSLIKQVDIDYFQSANPFPNIPSAVKGSLREGGIRVPFIASWPGHIEAGSQSNHISAFWDILPTICELTGTPLPSHNVDGISFAPTLLGQPQEQEHDYLYWEFHSYGGQQAIRFGQWKGLREQLKEANNEWQLYNLEEDIGEKQNVAKQYPEMVSKLTQWAKESRFPSKNPRWELDYFSDIPKNTMEN